TDGSNPVPSSGESATNRLLISPPTEAKTQASDLCANPSDRRKSGEGPMVRIHFPPAERCYGAGGEDGNFVAASPDEVPRCPSRTTCAGPSSALTKSARSLAPSR